MKLFEDLPSQNMPITAQNLNQIQDNLVVVSATEPTGDNREKVWMQKGKNLYNPQNAYITGNLSQNIGFIYRDIKAGQTYTFSATNYSWVSVKAYNSANELIREVGNTEFSKEVTITIQDTEIYVELLFYTGLNNLTSTNSIDFTNVQFEQGNKTEYEAYIEPKIYVKNDNNVYELFYKELKENILFEGETGDINSTIQLSDYSQNYKALIIEGKDDGTFWDSVRIDNANGKGGTLKAMTLNEDGAYYSEMHFRIENNIITIITNYTAVNRATDYSRYGSNNMKITKVIGIN